MPRTPAKRNLHTLKQQAGTFSPERWAGQQMGPCAIPWYKKGMSEPIDGAQTSSTTWQRTDGSWTEDSLICQWAFLYDSSAANPRRDAGGWYRITDNTADTITVEGSIPADADTLELSMYNPISEEVEHGESGTGAYSGVCFDGRYLWFAPRYATNILKLDTLSWDWDKIPHGEGNEAFEGCVFDGQCIWMVPRKADNWFKIDKDDHTITKWAHGLGDNAFSGAVFDGRYIWFAPRAVDLHRMDPADLSIETFDLPGSPDTYQTVGANFDGKHVWIIPDGGTPYLYKINPETSDIQTIDKPESEYGYSNSIFDGVWLWLVPFLTTDTPLTRVHVTTGKLETFDVGDSYTFHHHDGCFDGESLWLTPYNSADFIKVNPHTGEMVKYPHGKGDSAFAGCLFDGRSIWWAPYKSDTIVRQFPPRFGTTKPWDESEITLVDAPSSGAYTVTRPGTAVRVTDSDGGGGTELVLQLNRKTRPREIVVENDTGNTITINLNPDGGGGDTTNVNAGNAIRLSWTNASTGLYKWVALN